MTRRRIISTIVFCTYMIAVAYLCFGQPEDMPQISTLWFGLPADKVGHFLMFVPYPLLAYMIFETRGIGIMRHLTVIAAILTVGIGLAIGTEQIQAHLGYRDADLHDFYADAAGLAAGGLCTMAYIFFRRNK